MDNVAINDRWNVALSNVAVHLPAQSLLMDNHVASIFVSYTHSVSEYAPLASTIVGSLEATSKVTRAVNTDFIQTFLLEHSLELLHDQRSQDTAPFVAHGMRAYQDNRIEVIHSLAVADIRKL